MNSLFLELSGILGLTVVVSFIIRLLRQPLIVAYIISGLLAGPLLFNLLDGDAHTYSAFGEFGVVLLLYVVGLNLHFDFLKRIGKSAVLIGVGQVALSTLLGFGILSFFPLTTSSKWYLAIAVTFSSTIILTKLLAEKKDTESMYGRRTMGLMVVQDLIAVALMVILSSGTEGNITETIGLLLFKGALLIASIYFLAKFLLPTILDRVAKNGEFLFLFTIAWCFGVASLVAWAGFSLEIGALLAGISLGSSPYQAEIASRIRPLRDFFIVIFFLMLGSEMHVTGLATALPIGLALTAVVLIGHPLILYLLYRTQACTRRTSFLGATVAAQVSEFGFILLFTGRSLGHLQGIELQIFTVVALITICISSYIITYNEQLYRFCLPFFALFGKDKYRNHPEIIPTYEAWVFGYHRVGMRICSALQEKGVPFAVVDFNPDSIRHARQNGIPAYFGDAADVEFLHELPIEVAKLVISTLPETDDQKTLIHHVRSRSSKTKVIANTYDTAATEELYTAGAHYVLVPHLVGGAWMAHILEEKAWTDRTFLKLKEDQKSELARRFTDRGILRHTRLDKHA